jgi:malonyl CoA-acyl carrier protein transacylase
MMNTYTGALTILEPTDVADGISVPEGHVLVSGTTEDIERVAATVSAKYRAERKARNKAAKKSRRANRGN